MSSETMTERRDRTKKEIRQLIEDRNRVLSQFYELARISDEIESDDPTTLGMLDEFCQELVDYLAKGHFEIYRRIDDGTERRSDITSLAATIMGPISHTTQVAIDFNDAYDSNSDIADGDLNKLPAHLEKLGEELATRIELEDQFINALLDNAAKQSSVAEPA